MKTILGILLGLTFISLLIAETNLIEAQETIRLQERMVFDIKARCGQ